MVATPAPGTSIATLTLEEALGFVRSTGSVGISDPGKRPRAFGLFSDDGLIAAMVISNPRTREFQSLYTTELLALVAEPSQTLASEEHLLRHFMDLPKSMDLFAQESVPGINTADLESLGMATLGGTDTDRPRLYEWHNPRFLYYTYRISSTADGGYYLGRHGTTLTDTEAMLRDGYMGSGGIKYKNWVKSVGGDSLRKEILGVYSNWAEAVLAEELLIGDSHRTDPHCKNSMVGGSTPGGYLPEYTTELCPIHGETKFRGGCKKCSLKASKSLKECASHGETLHIGESCYRCTTERKWTEKECSVHGPTPHNGDSCQKCISNDAKSLKECPRHGICLHSGESCITCTVERGVSLRECPIHGETKHVGDHCRKCLNSKPITKQECPIHGLTAFKGDGCCKCSSAKLWTVESCSIHGETKHRAGVCEGCSAKSRADAQRAKEVMEECSTHGLTAHYRGKCNRCKAQSAVTIQDCTVHGSTKFRGETCGKCSLAKIWTTEECSTHGETKHRSGKCERCARSAQWAARKVREAEAD